MITPMASYDNTSSPVPAYDPLRVAAYTGGFGTMPSSQYLTPSGYGSYRSLPGANMSITPNMRPGFFGNAAIAMHFPFTYNPAVNPMVYRAHAARRASDTAATFGANVLGFGAEMGIGAGVGMAIGGATGMLAGAAAPFLLPVGAAATAFADRMRETRALQMRSMAKITAGRDLDLATGMGFSGAAASGIDRFIRRQGAGDFLFKEGDYRNIMNMGMEMGMFDYAGNAEQYKRQLKKLRNTFATAMSVLGSTDFKEILQDLKRMQNLGVTTSQMGGMLRREEGFARMAGMSHADLVSTYGQAGAVMATTRGLSGITGSLASMSHAASIRIAQQNGLVGPSRLAALGGESGYVTMATESSLRSEQNMEKLIAAIVSNNRGDKFDYGRMEALIRRAQSGTVDLVREATSAKYGMDAVAMQNLEINSGEMHKHFRDMLGEDRYKEFQRQIYQSLGNRMLAGNPNATEMDKLIAGYRFYTGADARQAAITMRAEYDPEVRRQNERSERLEYLRRRDEERERDTVWNRVGVAMSKFVNGLSDATVGRMQGSWSAFTDKIAAKAVGGIPISPLATSFQEGTTRNFFTVPGQGKAGTAVPKKYEFDAAGSEAINAFGEKYRGTQYLEKNADGTYKTSKDISSGRIDSVGWATEAVLSMMGGTNDAFAKQGRGPNAVYSREMMEFMKGAWRPTIQEAKEGKALFNNEFYYGGGAGLLKRAGEMAGGELSFTADDYSNITENMLLFSGANKGEKDIAGRYKDVGHTAVTYRDQKTGELMVSEMTERGERRIPLREWVRVMRTAKGNKFYAVDTRKLATEQALKGSESWNALQKKDAGGLAKAKAMTAEKQDYDLFNYFHQKARGVSFDDTIKSKKAAAATGVYQYISEGGRLSLEDELGIKDNEDLGMSLNEFFSTLNDEDFKTVVATLLSDSVGDNLTPGVSNNSSYLFKGMGAEFQERLNKAAGSREGYKKLLAAMINGERFGVQKEYRDKLFAELAAYRENYLKENSLLDDNKQQSSMIPIPTIFATGAAEKLGISTDKLSKEQLEAISGGVAAAAGSDDITSGLKLMNAVAINQAAVEANKDARAGGRAGKRFYRDDNTKGFSYLADIYRDVFKSFSIDGKYDDKQIMQMVQNPELFFSALESAGLNNNSQITNWRKFFSGNKNAANILTQLSKGTNLLFSQGFGEQRIKQAVADPAVEFFMKANSDLSGILGDQFTAFDVFNDNINDFTKQAITNSGTTYDALEKLLNSGDVKDEKAKALIQYYMNALKDIRGKTNTTEVLMSAGGTYLGTSFTGDVQRMRPAVSQAQQASSDNGVAAAQAGAAASSSSGALFDASHKFEGAVNTFSTDLKQVVPQIKSLQTDVANLTTSVKRLTDKM